MDIFLKNKRLSEINFKLEKNFEKEIFDNHKIFFGKETILIDAKKKIKTKDLGDTIPDGFLLTSQISMIQFYIIEAIIKAQFL